MHYITPNWNAPNCIYAYVTTKKNDGFSKGIFSNFNLSLHVADNPQHVLLNRKKLSNDLALPSEPRWLNQQHTNTIIELTKHTKFETQISDASFTKEKNIICAILTADCLPILVCNKNGTVVAAIHAGWRGLLSNIIKNTITSICKNNSIKPQDLLIWLGPAISQNFFNVTNEIYNFFISTNKHYRKAFKNIDFQWYCDLYILAKIQLHELNVTNIYTESFCTFQEKDYFYSYRRDGKTTGRIASLIWIK